MEFVPFNGYVVCSRLKSERTSRGGIVIPDISQEKSDLATVLASSLPWVKDGCNRTSNLRPDDLIILDKYGAREISIDGHKRVLIHEDNVLGKIRGFEDADRLPSVTTEPVEGAVSLFGDGIPGTVEHDAIPA